QNSQLVSVIEHCGEIIAVCREDEARVPGYERERIGVHSLGNGPQVGARCEAAALGRARLLGLRCSIEDEVTKTDEPTQHRRNNAPCRRSQSQAPAHDRAPLFDEMSHFQSDLPEPVFECGLALAPRGSSSPERLEAPYACTERPN